MAVQPRTLLFASAILAACAACNVSPEDVSGNADDIQLQVPAAKLSPKRITASGDHSLVVSRTPRFEQPLTVVLKLEGEPVAVARSHMPNNKLHAAERMSIESALLHKQNQLVSSIEALGGTVHAKFQNAINGIKVSGTADQIAQMARLPGVVEVMSVGVHNRLNSISVPFIGAPSVWDGRGGFRGEHIKVAIIDTGIDYTHANFGGPGTPAAYDAAFKAGTLPADPALFGPNAPKVKGGIDLVGDDYDASPAHPPVPDANPLDCGAHGSHVAGTVAGFGVNADGSTFQGPYDLNTPKNTFAIGPGVAPLAELYAVRVFGCRGSTNVVVEALDWAVKNDMQVVNMSLGSPFGGSGDADAEASTNASKAGIIVVSAAGNEGGGVYITGSPASGDEGISVAAMDSNDPANYPGVKLALGSTSTIVTQDSNNSTNFSATAMGVYVLPDGNGGVSLGCNESEYVDAQIAGKLVVTKRGTCARALRAQFGYKHGAAAVALINNGPGYPLFDGPIPAAAGSSTVVAIPFLGVLTSDGAALVAATAASMASPTLIPNPAYRAFADFSSGGPRTGDGRLKPDVSAPGVNIVSTAMGTGTGGVAFSGTSMATPHVAGVAALALEAHAGWNPADVRTAMLNTADAAQIVGFSVRMGGSGLVQPYLASRTSVTATEQSSGAANLSFGVAEFTSLFLGTKTIKLHNSGDTSVKFTVSATQLSGSPSAVKLSTKSVSVSPGKSATVEVTLTVPAATAGDSTDFREVAGLVHFTPASATANDGVGLTVPYYLVPRARSKVRVPALPGDFGPKKPKAVVKVRNESPSVTGTADFYSWGLAGTNTKAGVVGLRAVGVQSNTVGADQLLFFAINTFKPWSNNAPNEFDILIDTNGDGKPDFALVAADLGALTTGTTTGQMVTALFNLNDSTKSPGIQYPVNTPTDGTTLLLPVLASDLGVTSANPRFSYSVNSFAYTGESDTTTSASFNPFNNSVTTGSYATLAPGKHASVALSISADEWKLTPALGVMVVGMENFNGGQARLLGIGQQGDNNE